MRDEEKTREDLLKELNALSRQAAELREAYRCAGTQFDPAVVNALSRVLSR
ncbi:MAG: hypothetical protein OHK0032_09660 [Thermodesulfovibrionales bacterium]